MIRLTAVDTAEAQRYGLHGAGPSYCAAAARAFYQVDVGRLGISVVHSHWSRNVEARLSLVESFPSDACASSLMT